MYASARPCGALPLHKPVALCEILMGSLVQVVDLQERLIDLEEAELAAQAAASEAMRLSDENTLLAAQMQQMEVNVKVTSDLFALPLPAAKTICSIPQLEYP